MSSKTLQLYRTIRHFKDGITSLKELGIESQDALLKQLATVFDINISIDGDRIILDKESESKLKVISAEDMSHIHYVETLFKNEADPQVRSRLSKNIELLYEKVFSLTTIPADVIEWALNHDEFDLQTLMTIAKSIDNKISIGLRYFSLHSQETTLRQVDPFFLKYYRGQVYLIGFCYKHEETRTFLLSRIKGITETYDRFERDLPLSYESMFKHSLGIYLGDQNPKWIQLKCKNHLLPILKQHPLHASQQITLDASNYFTAKYQLVVTDELVRTLLQYGADLEIIFPESLRERLSEELNKMVQLYAK
jgi:predicted DNA-binding transcriptional regulator YafY